MFYYNVDSDLLNNLSKIIGPIDAVSEGEINTITDTIILTTTLPDQYDILEGNNNSIVLFGTETDISTLQSPAQNHLFHYLSGDLLLQPELLKIHIQLIQNQHMHILKLASRIEELEDSIFELAFATTDVLEKKEEMELLATKDSLTHLYNHSFFKEKLLNEFSRSNEHHHNFSIAILDLDHFKNVNDSYGHLTGDKVIKVFAKIISETIRPIDLAARYGGEEFAIIFTDADNKVANEIIENIRTTFNTTNFSSDNGDFNVTFSAGITGYSSGFPNIEAIIQLADEALYESKKSGRNCTHIFNYIDSD